MKSLELKIPPPVVALLVGAAMWAVARWTGIAPRPPGEEEPLLTTILTAGLSLPGLVVAVAGAFALARARTTMNPARPQAARVLVADGIFTLTRNPMYLGLALALAGWAANLGSLWAIPGVPLFMAYMSRFQIEPEEHALRAAFGEQFEAYAKRVRRWL